MKKMFKFILILLVVGLGYYFFTKNQIEIPNSMVNVAVKSKFLIEKSYSAGKIKLYNPKTKFENNKLIINEDALNDKISGTMTFETDLEYDFMNSKLYLNNLKLVDLTKEGEKIDISKKPIIRTGLNIALNQLEKKEILDLKQIEKFQLIKDINIENNKVVVIK